MIPNEKSTPNVTRFEAKAPATVNHAAGVSTGGWLVVGCQKPLLTFLSLLLQHDDVDAFYTDCIAMTSR